MKKFLYLIFLTFLFLITFTIIYLSTVGIETSKFNNLIIKEIKKKDPSFEVKLEKIKIKLDLGKIQLFLSTKNPSIQYQDVKIPITEIRIYTKINKILNKEIEVNQIIFSVQKFKTQGLQKIITRIKPSNFKTYLLNNINRGEIEKASFDLIVDKNFKLIDYKANGVISKVNLKISNNLLIEEIGFNFIVDKNIALINSINASYKDIILTNGSIDLQRKKNFEIKGKFESKFNLKEAQLNQLFTKIEFFKENKIQIQGSLLHEFNLKINDSFKIIDYEYKSIGNILPSQIILKKIFKNNFILEPIKKILFEKSILEINLNKKKNNLLTVEGLYSTDGSSYKKFKIKNNVDKTNSNYFIDINLNQNILIDIINFQTNSKKLNNLKLEFNIKNNKYIFKSINFKENKNSITIKGLVLDSKNEIQKLSSIKVQTFINNEENNNFTINVDKKISISGKRFDSTKLLRLLPQEKKSNPLKNFNNEIEIQIKNLITKSQIPLSNFNLLGSLQKGKFNKISAKSEFTEGKYLDISLKKDPNNKKILEVYSDYPRALLSDYQFFEGIRDGKLLYTSVIDETGSASKLTIENFKVIKAPTFATLLTLADLGGYADLLTGKGVSFNILEVNLKENAKIMEIEEVLALGKSVSLHMEGYVVKKTGLVSLSGTLVPAKMLNSLISKIPIVGNVLVGDKVGEGIFGVSFKIKGLPGKIKTTVNPIKTLTPRFITRALEKKR